MFVGLLEDCKPQGLWQGTGAYGMCLLSFRNTPDAWLTMDRYGSLLHAQLLPWVKAHREESCCMLYLKDE